MQIPSKALCPASSVQVEQSAVNGKAPRSNRGLGASLMYIVCHKCKTKIADEKQDDYGKCKGCGRQVDDDIQQLLDMKDRREKGLL